MNDFVEGAVYAILAFFLLIFIAAIGTIVGALAGWLIGLMFSSWIQPVLWDIGIEQPLWKVGAALGFVSGFFRNKVKVSKE